jgi:hypothetical protein
MNRENENSINKLPNNENLKQNRKLNRNSAAIILAGTIFAVGGGYDLSQNTIQHVNDPGPICDQRRQQDLICALDSNVIRFGIDIFTITIGVAEIACEVGDLYTELKGGADI